MTQDGYIKFKCNLKKSKPLTHKDINDINEHRNMLYRMGLIGEYENGIGYGNISMKRHDGKIIITGSCTGGKDILDPEDYVVVEDYSMEKNSVTCTGLRDASSETLTHAAVYECSRSIRCVIHIHNLYLWEKLLNAIPTTSKEVEYGTPEMADEIKRLYRKTELPEMKILAMAGHREGIITFGQTFDQAMKRFLIEKEVIKKGHSKSVKNAL